MASIGTTKFPDSCALDRHEERRRASSSSVLIYWCDGGVRSDRQEDSADDNVLELPAGWYWKGQHLPLGEPKGPFVTSGQAHKDACRGLSCLEDTTAA